MNSPDEELFPLREPSVGNMSQRPPGQPFVIMYHGSLVERHGLDLGIEAIRRVRRVFPQIELRVFGGRTPFLDRVLASIQGTEIEAVVRYLGGRRVDEIPGEIAGCDLGIIPNRRSIFTLINTPTRIFEYLACGKPVIAPDAPGIRDYFGVDDLITFELGNAEELAARIQFVIEQPDRVADIVRRGQNIYQKHRWSSERKVFVDLVSELAGETRPFVAAGGRASPQSA
jgi:glycosyltransferase involved in cell wall biosynthesis